MLIDMVYRIENGKITQERLMSRLMQKYIKHTHGEKLRSNSITRVWVNFIVANSQHASTYSPVAFRSVHTGIVPPFLLKIYYAITACMTQGFNSESID